MPPAVMLVAPEDHLSELEGQMKAATRLVPFKLAHTHNSVEAISQLKKLCATRDGVLAVFVHSRFLSGAKEEYSDTLRKYLKSNEPDIPVIAFGKKGDCGEEGKTYNSYMDTESGGINPRVAAAAIQAVMNGTITGGREGKGGKAGAARKSVDLSRKSTSSQDGTRRSIDGRPSEAPTRRASMEVPTRRSIDLRANMGPGSPIGSPGSPRGSSDMGAMGSPYYGNAMGPSPLGGGMMCMPPNMGGGMGGGMGGSMGGVMGGSMGGGMGGSMGGGMGAMMPMSPMAPMAPMAPMMGGGSMGMMGGSMGGSMGGMAPMPTMTPMLPMMQPAGTIMGSGSGFNSMLAVKSPAALPAAAPSMAAAAPAGALDGSAGGNGELIRMLAEEVVRLRTALAEKRGVAFA